MRAYWIIGFIFFSTCCTAADTIHNKQAELTRVTQQIEQLQKTIHVDREQQQALESQLKTTEITIGNLSQQINTLNGSIGQEQKKLTQLKKAQRLSTEQLRQQHNALIKKMQTVYHFGPSPSLKILFNQDNPSTLQRHLRYYRYLNQAQLTSIDKIKQSLTKLNVTLTDISEHQQTLQRLLNNKQEQQTEHQKAFAERKNVIDQLNQNVEDKQQQLTVLLANQKALQDIVAQLQVETKTDIIRGKPFNQLRGKLHWPVNGPFAARFGSSLEVGEQKLGGVLIKAKQGTPVQAIYEGKILFANWLRGFGLLIIVNHGNNYMSLYARNHTLNAKVGDTVKTGDIIATTGNSGGYDQSGLYFEIRQNGKTVNPATWCR